ncbi:MAG: sigma-54 dependent transcriptional regulator [Pseudomonadota bacterium]|nr:sigma-54 dependent transcriptional regulator [Pseudomonadota bacterium]
MSTVSRGEARRVLVVDDEANMRRVLEIMLARQGYKTWSAANGREAFERLAEEPADLVISDLRMPDMNGIDLLRNLRAAGNPVPLIMITAQGTIESAVEAMRLGACDYLLRPFDVETLDLAIGRVFQTQALLRQNAFLQKEVDRNWDGLIGDGDAMQNLRRQITQVAPTRANVLLTGETGTGKEVVARAVHRASDRKDRLFVPINCAAIPAEMLESEMFGHEKGAFTGAHKERVGKFELADGGTIFLDEITEMPAALQAKLLRVLQEGTVERLGSNTTIQLDVRVIAASNRRPRDAIAAGRLREDLFYRLNVFAIDLPPLRERREDISALVTHFVQTFSSAPIQGPVMSVAALEYLQLHNWPGNVRELANLVERALILSGGRMIDLAHLPQDDAEPASGRANSEIAAGDLNLDSAVAILEKRMISEAMRQSGGNKSRAAQLLQISERSIFYKIKKYGL